MARLVILLAVIGLAYWYWAGSARQSEAGDADRLRENAATMQQCIHQEQRMQSAGGLAGLADVGNSGEDAERLCARKNRLVERDGGWYSEQD
jgi:hypothetical protein